MPPAGSGIEDSRFHGRRRGRKLRPGHDRLLEDYLPELQLDLPADGPAIDPASWFPVGMEAIWLEIGFGAGEHLAWQAVMNPTVGIIGAEPYLNGVARLLAVIEAERPNNVRVLADDVRPMLQRLSDSSLARVFILFPDPWPKQRHHRRRIVNDAMLDTLARLMRDGAELRIATDDQDYLVWILRHFQAHKAFSWTATRADDWRQRPADWPNTRYENKNRSGGPGATFLQYRRVPRAC
ncbi:MAG: tRNA (guanosine(46)-N7)-methyltransferase TrmB [Alphaproteobacteria bacterium]|nr:tRNA (guanosine(46)-N7)-methyltransferase TrmB [Alphaproteobacteria bacterium]HCP01132.1 tRNA (guanosine(46)-N7)-methyltransferase TrmB [Rhodospirillaceae bacterium]